MRILLALLLLAAAPAAPTIDIRGGVVEYRGPGGIVRPLSAPGKWSSPTLSPDGRTAAFTLEEVEAEPGEMDKARSSLWIADVATGKARKLLEPRYDREPKKNLGALYNPVFSNDGRHVFVEAAAWATSPAIHRIELTTGRTRFVAGGALYGVLRNGPWRGNLVVGEHRYFDGPEGGSYEAFTVYRPDGRRVARLPEDTEVSEWLTGKGWRL
jgi:dipeptidyl aminopeptidase/acylaminoacyl peptidase